MSFKQLHMYPLWESELYDIVKDSFEQLRLIFQYYCGSTIAGAAGVPGTGRGGVGLIAWSPDSPPPLALLRSSSRPPPPRPTPSLPFPAPSCPSPPTRPSRIAGSDNIEEATSIGLEEMLDFARDTGIPNDKFALRNVEQQMMQANSEAMAQAAGSVDRKKLSKQAKKNDGGMGHSSADAEIKRDELAKANQARRAQARRIPPLHTLRWPSLTARATLCSLVALPSAT